MSVLFSLIGVGFVAGLVALVGGGLSTHRPSYLTGVGAAVVAYLIALAFAAFGGRSLLPDASLAPLVVSPLVEEAIRVAAIAMVIPAAASRSSWGQGLAFGVGYALVEAGAKLGDSLVLVAQAGDVAHATAMVITPLVPFLLHVFLSLVAFALRRARLSLLLVFVITLALHMAHNASVLYLWLPSSYEALIVANLARSALFVVLIAALIWRHHAPEGAQPAEAR